MFIGRHIESFSGTLGTSHLVVTIVDYWPQDGMHLADVMPMIALHIY